MIIVNLMGGLGNQMLQYSLGRALAHKHNTVLKIDNRNFNNLASNKSHTFQINQFNIIEEYASENEILKFTKEEYKNSQFVNFLRKMVFLPIRKRQNKHMYKEPDDLRFKSRLLNLTNDMYLFGYFSSYKYFDEIRPILLKEFTLKNPLSIEGKEILNLIDNSNSVSIHFRRGDVIEDPAVIPWFKGICTDDYYRNAIDLIISKVESPHFFVFSNEIDWVKENFKLPYPITFVEHNTPQSACEDMYLMSKCKHNILGGGSSFSWWAAYLNQNSDKVVVHSHKYCNIPKYNHPQDLFLPEWFAVDS